MPYSTRSGTSRGFCPVTHAWAQIAQTARPRTSLELPQRLLPRYGTEAGEASEESRPSTRPLAQASPARVSRRASVGRKAKSVKLRTGPAKKVARAIARKRFAGLGVEAGPKLNKAAKKTKAAAVVTTLPQDVRPTAQKSSLAGLTAGSALGEKFGHQAKSPKASPETGATANKLHRVVIQVSQNDPAVMNMVLNNAENLTKHFREKGEKVQIELVAYGPGLHMVRSDTSPVKARLKALTESTKEVTVSGCENTGNAQAKQENQETTLIPEARFVSTGIGRITELQETRLDVRASIIVT